MSDEQDNGTTLPDDTTGQKRVPIVTSKTILPQPRKRTGLFPDLADGSSYAPRKFVSRLVTEKTTKKPPELD